MWNETTMAQFEIIFWNLLGGAGENHINPQSR
jgi:hypothetical protein